MKHPSFDPQYDPSPQQESVVLLFEDSSEEGLEVRYLLQESGSLNSTSATGEANLQVMKQIPGTDCWYVTHQALPSPYHYQEPVGLMRDEAPELIQVNYAYPCPSEELLIRADARPDLRVALDSLDDYPCLDDQTLSEVEGERLREAFDIWFSADLESRLPDGETEDGQDLLYLMWFEAEEEEKWNLFLAAMEESGVWAEEYSDGLSIDVDEVAPYWLRLLREMWVGWLSSNMEVLSDPIKVAHVCWAIIQLRRVI